MQCSPFRSLGPCVACCSPPRAPACRRRVGREAKFAESFLVFADDVPVLAKIRNQIAEDEMRCKVGPPCHGAAVAFAVTKENSQTLFADNRSHRSSVFRCVFNQSKKKKKE